VIFRETLVIALRGLRAHKLRSGLTMLGLIIGVAAVIILAAFGQGVEGSVNAAIAPIANSITVVPKLPAIQGGPAAEPLTDDDAEALAKIPEVASVTPVVTGSTTGSAGQVSRAVTAQTPGREYLSASVTGTTTNWYTTNDRELSYGQFFSSAQERANARVAVIGPSIAYALFNGPEDAVGKTLRINHRLFQVIGVMKSYGRGNDDNIVVPMGAARAGIFGYGYGGDELSSISIKATSIPDAQIAEKKINQVLDEQHHITDRAYQDFQVQTQGSRMESFTSLISLLTGFTPVIAAISLLVGGIGVLNIMLVSVTDRTREIGTRKAVGASDGAILSQFVLEAIALAGFGGLVGVGLGVGSVLGLGRIIPLLGTTSRFLRGFTPVLSVATVLVAFGISLAIGLAAGGYPAWRAAQLNPIEALRYE
jgi:putative ABC transport system permease protein